VIWPGIASAQPVTPAVSSVSASNATGSGVSVSASVSVPSLTTLTEPLSVSSE
jgi:hypothetical protein